MGVIMKIHAYPVVLAFISVGLFVSSPSARGDAASAAPCVEVQIGQDIASHINCVNEALRRTVEHEHDAPIPEAPITAQSSSNKVGTFNDAAARQMMGNAFGVSSQPQRSKPTFASPLLHYAGPSASTDSTHAIAIARNGQIVYGGARFLSTSVFGVARVNADGTADTAFGSGGALTTNFQGDEGVTALVVQPDGAVVAVGYSEDNTTGQVDVAIARYLG